jgi:NAD(P)H dehydrogenase (quinone)
MKVLVLFYSMYGHVERMARAVAEGAASVEGVEPVLRRAPEFKEILEQKKDDRHFMEALKRQEDVPECTLEDLAEADGLMLGTPTRYGSMSAQMKRLIDSTASLWMQGAMEGKPAGVFTSTSTSHGGQETTLLCTIAPLLHLGMIVVGVPYSTPGMIHAEARGGTPYGASTLAGPDNALTPAQQDLEIARAQGRRVAETAKALRGGQA